MIATILSLIKLFLKFKQKYNLKKKRFSVDLIESFAYSSGILTDSSVIFKNCKAARVNEEPDNDSEYLGRKCVLKNQERMQNEMQRLNALKKMENDEEKNKDILNGIITDMKGNLVSPASDCNSNNLSAPKENMILCSMDSLQDWPDFSHDNSEFQWCLDFGYKYNNSHHQSVLSLSRSQDLIYYDDVARNIDANLAEVDMDEFNREDIHSVLSSLPNVQGVEEREMFASVTGSMMVKFDFDSSISPRSNSQTEQINTSICKSQPLFSPVRENYLPNSSLSVDSLDLSENDINLMVTCQSNKNNYTIAFEGSSVMTSDDSESHETCTSGGSKSEESRNALFEIYKPTDCERIKSNCRSAEDSTFTTWSKIKDHPSDNLNLKRHLSKNNNTTIDAFHCSRKDKLRSLSLPNLFRPIHKQNLIMSLSVQHKTELSDKSLSSDYQCVKLYDVQSNSKNVDQSISSASKNAAHSFSLVKLFMKQKSLSHEGMSNYISEQSVGNSNCNIGKGCEIFDNQTKNRIIETQKLVSDKRLNECEIISFEKINKNDEAVRTKTLNGKHATTSLSEYLVSKNNFSNHKAPDHNGYYSDESTQENGSNTESAENLTCHCVNAPIIGHKKLLTEKSIQTSKVLEISENTQKDSLKVPVYILYPNYSLPNLEFLKREHYVQNIDLSKVFLKPQKFHAPLSPVKSSKGRNHGNRPFSVNDIETLKKTGFKHVRDWESLTFLLPKEYKQFLQEIPEIVSQLKDIKSSKEEVVPLFCLSPPPNRRMKRRPNSCDVDVSFDCRSCNFSSTATQPSSGYRGSSTMLNSNNSNYTNSSQNHSFSYKHHIDSESGSSRRTGHLSHKKHSSADESNENCSQKPFLLKSILRNNSLDCQPHICKTQKENANKRYSMVELSDKNLVLEENCNKRRSLHNSNSKLLQTSSSKANEQNQLLCESEENSNKKSSKMQKSLANVPENYIKSNLKNDMRRLEELLEISAVFGESVESFTETDMMKLRSQVSKFLTMQKNLEKVSETLQTIDEAKINDPNSNKTATLSEETNLLPAKHLQTPHNTPEHKKPPSNNRNVDLNVLMENYLKPFSCNGQVHEFEEEDCKFKDENFGGLKKTVSFAEQISFAVKEHEAAKEISSSNFNYTDQKKNQAKVKRPVDLPICEETAEGALADSPKVNLLKNSSDLLHKRDLILDVGSAVKKILKLCKESKEDPANMCLHHLCPCLYAVLSDGLKEEIDTPFGPIKNSVWSVLEASSQQGPMTQTLNELVQRLNREDIFTEGLIKFNAFIFGLLNARALDGWFSFLRTRDSLLRRYYDHSSLLLLSNTAGAPFRILVDHLINILEPLCSLHFNLDLMYQTKLLHCSLQNLNSLLEEPCNNDFLTPTKQFMLLKLVQSIHNSLNQTGEGKKSKHILDDIERKTTDPPVCHLLEKNKSLRTRRSETKARPRSGCDSAATGKEETDVVSAMKKRWSGVNLHSKLTEAFDRLLDESESDYTDSLDVPTPLDDKKKTISAKNIQKEKNTNISTKDSKVDKAVNYTKEQKKNILLNLNKKSNAEISDCKTECKEKESFDKCVAPLQNGGQKFKRLHQKWERWEKNGLSPSDSDSDIQSPSLERTPSQKEKSVSSKYYKSEKPSCDSSTMPSPTSRISKIPRLVTSPLSTTPSAIKPTGNVRKTASPTCSNDSVQMAQKALKTNYINNPRANSLEGKVTLTGGSKFSRAEKKSETVPSADNGKSQTVSPASLSHRRSNTTLAKKNELVSKRTGMSLGRKPAGKKLHQVQRTVRTLTHRLPSDSGHLSFNGGEKLIVILEVDKAWLLCCRGNQKGLVPKSLVISDIEDRF